MNTHSVVVHDYDSLLSERGDTDFSRFLERNKITPNSPQESSWDFRKRAFIDICLKTKSYRLALAFLILLRYKDWSDEDKENLQELYELEPHNKKKLETFLQRYEVDPIVERDYSYPSDRELVHWEAIVPEVTLPPLPRGEEREADEEDDEETFGLSLQKYVIEAVAQQFGVSLEDVISHHRAKRVVTARHVCAYILRESGKLSFLQIGAVLNKDHTTIIHAYQKISKRKETDPEVAEVIGKISAELEKISRE